MPKQGQKLTFQVVRTNSVSHLTNTKRETARDVNIYLHQTVHAYKYCAKHARHKAGKRCLKFRRCKDDDLIILA